MEVILMQITIYASIRKDQFIYSRVESPTTNYKLNNVPSNLGFNDKSYYIRRLLTNSEASLDMIVDHMGNEMYNRILPTVLSLDVEYNGTYNRFVHVYSVAVCYGLKFKELDLPIEIKYGLADDMNKDIAREEKVFL